MIGGEQRRRLEAVDHGIGATEVRVARKASLARFESHVEMQRARRRIVEAMQIVSGGVTEFGAGLMLGEARS